MSLTNMNTILWIQIGLVERKKRLIFNIQRKKDTIKNVSSPIFAMICMPNDKHGQYIIA